MSDRNRERLNSRTPAIGPYEIVRELGRGAQTIVYLAREEGLVRPVALKVLRGGSRVDWRRQARFRREAEAVARLDHPGICKVYRADQTEDFHYIAMEFVEGETLAKRIEHAKNSRNAGPVDVTLEGDRGSRLGALVVFFEKLSRALHAAHEAGITHRDIKPANIIVTPGGEPVLLDFGLAHDAEGEDITVSLTGVPLGTPAYSPPEQIEASKGQLDARSDLYALGATLYECLTLHQPHEGSSRDSVYWSILSRTPDAIGKYLPDAPDDLGVIVNTAMAKEQERRYQTALDLAGDLRRFRTSQPIRARAAGPLRRLGLWARRNPALAAAGSAFFLALMIGLLVIGSSLGVTLQAIDEKQRHTDFRAIPFLKQAEEVKLWPARPEKIPAMDEWLSQVGDLLFRARDYEDLDGADGQEQKAAFLEGCDRLSAKIKSVEARRREAIEVARRTDEFRSAWSRAIDEIADRSLCPAYDGLRIAPQLGLVPIGRDPRTNLYEFGHFQTGEIPQRDAETGRIVMTDESGLVFVLLPAGRFRMGAVKPSADHPLGEPNVDPWAHLNEGPVREVELDPFFISKYELTQGQWLRLTGEDLSAYSVSSWGKLEVPHPYLNSVHADPWEKADQMMRRLGLCLPTEAQWEFAARANTTTIWWTGNERQSLEGATNIRDQSFARVKDETSLRAQSYDWEPWDDGYPAHAPVGSFEPNRFGLHDTMGNAKELVRDVYGSYNDPTKPGTGERLTRESPFRVLRGGNYQVGAVRCRSASRTVDNRTGFGAGIRPARTIDGPTPPPTPSR